MAQGVASNPKIPPISQPLLARPDSFVTVAAQTKQAIDVIAGRAGGQLDRLCSLQDLITLGLVSQTELVSKLKGQG